MKEKKDVKPRSVYMRKWREEKGESWKEYMRNWRAGHREQIKASRRAHYKRNKTAEVQSAKDWYAKNTEKGKNIARASQARRKYSGPIDAEMVQRVFERDNYTCHWCSKPELKGRDLTIEHLEPVNDIDKLKTACLSCNSAKLHRRPEEAKRRRKKEH